MPRLQLSLTVSALLTFSGCAGDLNNPGAFLDAGPRPDTGTVGCDLDVETDIFAIKCGSSICHDSEQPAGDLDLVSVDPGARMLGHTSAGCSPSLLIDPDNRDQGFLFEKIAGPVRQGCGDPMPYGASPLSSEEIACVAAWAAALPAPQAGDGPFAQAADGSQLLVIEAEHFATNTAAGGHTWEVESIADASGGSAMRADPDTGTNNSTDFTTTSPRLDFEASFVATGTHYVWVRYRASGGEDDSIHAGLDGAAQDTSDHLTASVRDGNWEWSKATNDAVDATLDLATVGEHTVNIWMREDGARIDKIVLTPDAAFTPNGAGPGESPRAN